MAWKLGIKAFAVYRDGSKTTQPLQTEKSAGKGKQAAAGGVFRRKLPVTRSSETHKFSIAGHEGYLTYGMYEDGTLAEIFIKMAKQGSTLAGLLDAFAISVSMALQYGVPLRDLARKFIYSRFEPAGFTENENIRIATSIVDYIFRFLALRFLTADDLSEFGLTPLLEQKEPQTLERTLKGEKTGGVDARVAVEKTDFVNNGSAKPLHGMNGNGNGFTPGETVCRKCGGMMVRTGTCLTCLQCGESSGGCS
jgi:ribonucleoside-diphosphate reductase alpha chain